MSARTNAALAVIAEIPAANARPSPEITWVEIARRAPQMASTMARYLDQLAVSARPATVTAVDLTLRQFADCVTMTDPTCHSMTLVKRSHFEDYKRWLARRPGIALTAILTLAVAIGADPRAGARPGRPVVDDLVRGDG